MLIYTHWASLMAQWVKNLTAMQETQDTLVWFLGWEDTLEKGGGNPFQYSCLKNPIDGGTWWAAVQKIAKSQIYTDSYLTEQLSTHTRLYTLQFSSVQSLSRIQLFATPWTAARQASLSITNFQSPPKPMSIESVILSNHLILYRPLFLLPSIFPSIRVFSSELAFRIRWPKYWSFSFNISPSNEHPGLISFRMDWFDLAVQGTLKSILQHHSSKASILLHSASFFSPTLASIHDHWKNHSLD